ncbi:Gamma-butyrobetaine dioxygenase (EC [Amycolatopsis camponoti]|uniref:Gamma-butyrobetaine dioxygenase (EC) n=1 Tax=Amycolatopsis camponoti TaxID=2606593 RepID=A0A6I8M0G5_9PSEU|nr:Gamma-butyrobetaine dioxygenase (EC [Amycolatopsis camponoti]
MSLTVLSECSVDIGAVGGVGELAAVLARDGVALFDGVRTEPQLLQLATRLGQLVHHRDNSRTGLTVISDRGNDRPPTGQGGFSRHALSAHTDCSNVPRPPLLVAMTCNQTADHGGDCVLVDGRAVHEELADRAPEALADLSARRGAYFGGAAGIVGNVFEPNPCGLVGIRLRRDRLARFSPQTQRWLAVLAQVIDRHTVTIPTRAGSGYVVNNRRWLHGRTAFTGPRRMYRALIEPRPAWRIPAGFTPVVAP